MTKSLPVTAARPRILLVAIVTALLTLLGAAVSAPAQARPLEGPRLSLLDPPSTFPAGTPFFVDHGLCGETAEERAQILRPTSRFTLTVDGSPVRLSMDLEASAKRIDNPDLTVCKQYSAEFAEGLPAGVHDLVGCWYLVGEDLGCEAVEVTFG